jgi:hypothetical protein
VVDSFTACLREALNQTAKSYIDYVQANNLNFGTDVIKIPTGDGAAVIFSFEGLHDIHLNFARELLRIVDDRNRKSIARSSIIKAGATAIQTSILRLGSLKGRELSIAISMKTTMSLGL